MCVTDEGKETRWAVVQTSYLAQYTSRYEHVWKSVDKLTPGAFVGMWQQRVDNFYSHYVALGQKQTLELQKSFPLAQKVDFSDYSLPIIPLRPPGH